MLEPGPCVATPNAPSIVEVIAYVKEKHFLVCNIPSCRFLSANFVGLEEDLRRYFVELQVLESRVAAELEAVNLGVA